MLSSFRTPRRRRISVGPQSEADAREYLANREHKRRGASAERGLKHKPSGPLSPTLEVPHGPPTPLSESPEERREVNRSNTSSPTLQVHAPERSLLTPPLSDAGTSSDGSREEERNDREMFSALEKPRTHYDVEVITKLVVYTGMSYGFRWPRALLIRD
jgi:dihydrosphingosine 1-phosphate phosphatase